MDEVKDTAQGTMDVAGGVKDDIIQLNFYKNPILFVNAEYYFHINNSDKALKI